MWALPDHRDLGSRGFSSPSGEEEEEEEEAGE